MNSHRNLEIKNIITPGIPQHFSWSKGLVPAVPEIAEIIKPKTVPVDIFDLVKILNGKRIKKNTKKSNDAKPEQKFHGKPKVLFSDNGVEGLINIS
jgi:hypothetical protein